MNRRQANFVDSVTHELKTPIASLKLYLETLQMREVEPGQQAKFFKIMQSELRRLDELINQLLKVGRLDAIGHESPPEDIELSVLLRRCAQSACARNNCDLEDVFTFDFEDVSLNSRRMLLDMVFGNLMDNAIKYGAEQPHVEIKVRRKSNDRVTVRVTDNGEGIPRESRNKIFSLFYRDSDELTRKRKGTGLGLYIVRTLLALLKGRVSVESRADQSGTVFTIDLPRQAPLTRQERAIMAKAGTRPVPTTIVETPAKDTRAKIVRSP